VTTTEAELRLLAARGAAELDGADAMELLHWTDENFGPHTAARKRSSGDRSSRKRSSGGYVVASNMQDAVLVDMAAKVRPGVDVLFLDTGYHFAETIGTRLFARDPNECCRMRKVEPLGKALSGFSAWVTGIRRVEAPTRAAAPLISFDEAFKLVKINPLAAWTDEDLQNYIELHGVLVNTLVEEGYPSIGCAPCTAKPVAGSDPRSGRWQGLSKTECGLHVS
jgi:phosphoadenosine phosphosulfate reductase